MARRRPEFEPGLAGAGSGVLKNASFLGWAVAAKLNKVSAGVPEDASSLGWGAGGTQIQWLPDAARTDFSITSGINLPRIQLLLETKTLIILIFEKLLVLFFEFTFQKG